MPAWLFIVFIHCSEIEVTYRSIGPMHLTIINHNLKYSCIDQVTIIINFLSYPIGSYKAITLEESAEAFLTAYDELCNTNMKGGKLSVHLICGEHTAMMVVIDVFKKLLQKEEFETGRDATTQSSGTGRDTAIQNSGTGRDTAIQDSGSGKDTATQNSGTGRDTSTQDSGGDRVISIIIYWDIFKPPTTKEVGGI